MKEIKIVIPDGYEIDTKKSTPTNIVFKKISSELPPYWIDYCFRAQRNGYYISDDCTICSINDTNSKNIYSDRNLLNTKEDAEAHLALMQLHQLRDCYRKGWKQSEDDLGFAIDYYSDSKRVRIYKSYCYRFLTFQSVEIAEEFSENFISLIEKAKDLLDYNYE